MINVQFVMNFVNYKPYVSINYVKIVVIIYKKAINVQFVDNK